MIFDREWFEKHQKVLLRFANSWLGRKILCIDGNKSEVGKNKIVKLSSNSITWIVRGSSKKVTLKTEFRIHEKFGKRLYYSFYFFWIIAHIWDVSFANPFFPNWNLGFDTATFYPDANPETTSVDGYVQYNPAAGSWAALRGGAGNAAGDADASFYNFYLENTLGTTSGWSNLVRSIYLFDTSSLTSSATISATTLSIYVISKGDNFAQNIGIVSSTPASNTALVAADYAQLGTTRYATDLDLTNITTSAYNDWTFNATGISNVSKTGVSKFGLRCSGDIDNVEPTPATANANLNSNFADTAGTGNDPKLVVTYSLPVSLASYRSLLGVGL
jgi:hypothetical protein